MPMSRGESAVSQHEYILGLSFLLNCCRCFNPFNLLAVQFVQSLLFFKTFYFVFLRPFCLRIPVSSLVDSWPSLLALLKDSVQLGLPAPGQFLILGLVSLPSYLNTTYGESVLQSFLNVSV